MTPATAATAPGGCHSCDALVGTADTFCESCGPELTPPSVSHGAGGQPVGCESCGSSRISADGFCESCGNRTRPGRDHQEVNLGLVAGVTDRGLRHPRNEDAMALAPSETETGPAVVAVVCDGVSTSSRPDEASLAAVPAAAHALLAAVRTSTNPVAASSAAVRTATEAVTEPAGPLGDSPGVIFIPVVSAGGDASVCWLGDSRAYWLAAGPGSAAERLTRDDSVAEEMAAAGLLSAADALASAYAREVTRCVGGDLSELEPHIVQFAPPGPGSLLLCSDGLWNYQPEAAGLAELALPAALTEPVPAVRNLVRFALDTGGVDNVTAVLAPPLPARLARR